jgi:hypothetical protein
MVPGKGLSRVVRVCAVVAALGYGGYYAYDRLLQPDEIRRRVIEEMTAKFEGVDVEVGHARMRPFLGGINVSDLKLIRRDDPTRTPFLHVPHAVIWHDKADIARRLSPAKIELEDAHLRLVRDAAGKWNVADVMKPAGHGDQAPVFVLKKAKVEVIDQASGSSAVLEFQEMDVSVVNDPAKVYTFEARGRSTPIGPFTAKGRYEIGHGANGTLDLGGVVLGPDLARVVGLVAPDVVEPLQTVGGTASSKTRWTWKPGRQPPLMFQTDFELTGGRCSHPALPGPVENLAMKGRFKDGELVIETMTGRLGECGLSVKLEIDAPAFDPNTDPMLAMAADIEERVRRFELNLTNLQVGPALFDRVCPRMPPKYVEIRDMFDPAGPADITFECRREKDGQRRRCLVKPKGMSATYRGFRYPLQAIRGTIEITLDEDGAPRFAADLVGEAGGKAVSLKGQIKGGPDREVDLLVSGTDVVLDKTLIDALPDEFPRLVRSLRPTARGDFTAKIRTNPKIRRDHGPEAADNEFDIRLRAGSLNYDEFPYPLKNLVGRLVIRTVPDTPTVGLGRGDSEIGTAVFENFKATGPGGCQLTINGSRKPEPGGNLLSMDVTGEAVPLDGELFRAVAKLRLHKSWQAFDPSGRMNCQVKVQLHTRSAPSSQPAAELVPARDLELGLSFNGPSIRPNFFSYQLTDAAGQVGYEKGIVTILKFSARHGATAIELENGTVRLPPTGGFYADLYDLKINPLVCDREFLYALPRGLKSAVLGLEPQGPIMAHARRLVIDGQPEKSPVPQVVGRGNTVITARATMPLPEREKLPTIYWDGTVTFRKAAIKTGVSWEDVTGQFTSRGLYLGNRLGRVIADLTIDRGKVLKQPIDSLSARFEVDPARPDVLEVPWINARAYGGEIGGEARLELGMPVKFDIRLNGSKLRLEEFARVNQMGPKTHVEGLANAQLSLSNPLDPLTRKPVLHGGGSIDIPDGKMLDLPVMLDVIKLARLRPMDKTMFEEAHAVFRIRDNRMKFGQLDLIGNAVSLGGDGEMDLDGKNAQFEFYTVWTNIRNLLGVSGELPARVSSNLYRIRVSGNLGVDKPRVTQEPLPAVLEPVRRLLGRANP